MTKTEMENKINKMKVEIQELTNENLNLKNERSRKDKAHKDEIQKLKFELSIANKDIDRLSNEIDILNKTIKTTIDKRIQELNNEYINASDKLKAKEIELNTMLSAKSIHNVRGAGRKSIINDELKYKVYEMHDAGNIQKLIAESLGISVGTVNKILNETKPIVRI